ncbi:MAG: GDP-L-fucose synthase [Proteobacteria bacterium]|nr:GDP-L-fucose synthase [Pseudomonadota bacterium]
MSASLSNYDLKGKRVWVAGHRGMVGSAIVRRLANEQCEVISVGRDAVDLRRQDDVSHWLAEQKPDAIFLAAATVGGIQANNTRPAEFLYDNLVIETNIIHAAKSVGVKKLMFLGSACIYPRLADQPMAENALLTGPLEPTNEWYAIAKIAGIKLCDAYRRQYGCDFISAMPNNLYGPGDNFDLESSHVVPALIRKIHEAKMNNSATVSIWGSGKPLREFLFVDDCADAIVFLMKHYSAEGHVNMGSGQEVSIGELAGLIAEIVEFKGDFDFDTSRPDGAPRKLLDVSLITDLGWQARTSLKEGLLTSYRWFADQLAKRPLTP